MSEAAIISKLLFHAVLIGALGEPDIGIGAYYAPGLMQRVCEHRVAMGWNDLDCSWPCLVSAIEPKDIEQQWAVDVPGAGMHL